MNWRTPMLIPAMITVIPMDQAIPILTMTTLTTITTILSATITITITVLAATRTSRKEP